MKKELASWQIDVMAAVAMLAIATGAYYFELAPAMEAREERARHAAELTEAREKSADLELAQAAVKEKLRSVKQSVAQSVKLEPAAQINVRVAKLTEMAAANSLQVDTIEPGTGSASGSGRYDTIPIRLSGRGAYKDVAKYLRTLHETMADTGIGLLELASAENGSSATFVVMLQWHTIPTPRDATMKVAANPPN
jgi:Tfp pilus assembly protein PilO